MAAYAALASLSRATDLSRNQNTSPFSIAAEENIRSIHDYVIFLLSFLDDFPAKSSRWEAKIRDLAHETEDAIDQFMLQKSYNRWAPSSKFEEHLRNLTEFFCLIAGDMMDERPASSSPAAVSSSMGSALAGNHGAVVGLDDDVMAIKHRLCGASSKLQFVPVEGMGGIGKTTLARTVYDDRLILEHFHIRAWLTVSQDYTAHNVLLGLLDSIRLIEEKFLDDLDSMKLIEENVGEEEVDDDWKMQEKVYKKLKGRRYLIVMDDVWNTEVLDDVRYIFPDDHNGSRIMLTTRIRDVATYPDSNSHPHKMQVMNDSKSWDLLKEKVFANKNYDCPPELEAVGKEIARSCGGLPLAIVLVAGFLSKVNMTLSFWEEIAENVTAIVSDQLEGILSLSYSHLPHYLRPCFLFLAIYPEDENIRASTLIRLWLAEGFLKHDNGCEKSLEEEAEVCLEDLVKRNLVIVTSRKSDGKIKSCGLHDMVRDFCIRKARDEQFLRIMNDHRVVPQGMTNDFTYRYGRLNDIATASGFVESRDVEFLRVKGNHHVAAQGVINERRISARLTDVDHIFGPTIRTILCFQLRNFPSSQAFWGHFRLLKVLVAVCYNNDKLPLQVFELFHLRYLAIVCRSHIPSAIANFINLQTLILVSRWKRYWRVNADVSHISMPLEIWRMPQLRHLIFYNLCRLPHPPNGSDPPLGNLQTLSYVKDFVWTERILQMIPNVKKLGLAYSINNEHHLHLIKHLHRLEKLKIYGFNTFSMIVHKPTFPRTLKKLTLVRVRFPWKDMSIIGSLPNLQVLKLRGGACEGETWETVDGEFPELRFLLIEGSLLQHWITESSHFPRLKCLVLRSCWALKEIPECFGEIPTLEMIEVDALNSSLLKSANQINEEQQNYGNDALRVHVSRFISRFKEESWQRSAHRYYSTKETHGLISFSEDIPYFNDGNGIFLHDS